MAQIRLLVMPDKYQRINTSSEGINVSPAILDSYPKPPKSGWGLTLCDIIFLIGHTYKSLVNSPLGEIGAHE